MRTALSGRCWPTPTRTGEPAAPRLDPSHGRLLDPPRSIGSDDRIDETGKVGEVQPVCPTDSGVDGTVPGGISQVTLTLAPGSYEVVCNLPGHYRSGMYATLTVS